MFWNFSININKLNIFINCLKIKYRKKDSQGYLMKDMY